MSFSRNRVIRVGRLYRTAVEDYSTGGGRFSILFFETPPDEGVDLLGLGGGGGPPRPDGPDGLIGEDDPSGLAAADLPEPLVELGADPVHGPPGLPLLEGFADAEDGGQAVAESRPDLPVDGRVGLAEELPPLGMADDDASRSRRP